MNMVNRKRWIVGFGILIAQGMVYQAYAQDADFARVNEAKACVRSALSLQQPYVVKGRELQDSSDAKANEIQSTLCDGRISDAGRSDAPERCSRLDRERADIDRQVAANNVILDRSKAILDQCNAGMEEAQEVLASRRISNSNPNTPAIQDLRDQQSDFFAARAALQSFEDHKNSQGFLARAFNRVKDSLVDHQEESLKNRADQTRQGYLAALKVASSTELELSDRKEQIVLPVVSEAALTHENRKDCIEPARSNSVTDTAITAAHSTFAALLDSVERRTPRSDESRCGAHVSPIEEKSVENASAQAAPLVDDRNAQQSGAGK